MNGLKDKETDMGLSDHAKGLTGYNEWANAKLLKAVAEASPADLQTEIGPGAGTIAQGLRHMVNFQRFYFSVIAETEFQLAPVDEDPLDGLEEVFAVSTAEMKAFAGSVTGEQMGETAFSVYEPFSGYKRWQILTHLVNHSTHHRSELGRALGNLGHSPGDMDFLLYAHEAG
jgi:uncharacterized damage-inducible protein DinB